MFAGGTGSVATAKCPVLLERCMAELTLVKVHLDEGSFSANLPFSGQSGSDGSGSVIGSDDEGAGVQKEESGGPGKGAAALGVLLVLILATVVVKYLSGGDDEEVAIETADDGPVGVSVDTDEE